MQKMKKIKELKQNLFKKIIISLQEYKNKISTKEQISVDLKKERNSFNSYW